jgi:Protein of unknown function (DUF3237)
MDNRKLEPMVLPELKLEKLFYLEAKCDPIIPVGDVGKGILNIYPIRGGYFEGEKLKGTILPLGADWNYLYADGIDVMDTRYALQTDDGAIISISTNGRYIIEPEMDKALDRGEFIDPNQYYFRQHLFFETGHEKYHWLNGVIAVAVMAVKPTGEICYNAYQLV